MRKEHMASWWWMIYMTVIYQDTFSMQHTASSELFPQSGCFEKWRYLFKSISLLQILLPSLYHSKLPQSSKARLIQPREPNLQLCCAASYSLSANYFLHISDVFELAYVLWRVPFGRTMANTAGIVQDVAYLIECCMAPNSCRLDLYRLEFSESTWLYLCSMIQCHSKEVNTCIPGSQCFI